MRRALFAILFFALPAFAQETITPDQLWSAMLKGNEQFVKGKITYDNLKVERELLTNGQMPPITVLACSDSRVPPELLFNQSLGALFIVRTAGNVADEFGIASIEYALAQQPAWTKLIIVLAHADCGAVKASLGTGDPDTPSLLALATRIRLSFVDIPYDAKDKANIKKATEANARASAAQLLAKSTLIRNAVAVEKRVKIVTAYYDMETGTVKQIE